jgi:hypothetical protein
MAENDNEAEAGKTTRVAWALQRRRKGRTIFIFPLEVGSSSTDPDGTVRIVLDREPKGGYGDFDAEIVLLPKGVKPSAKAAAEEPFRPEPSSESDDADSHDSQSPPICAAARASTGRR